MSISTNKCLNHIVIGLGRISNGKIEDALIHILYWWRRMFPPIYVKNAKKYYENHANEISMVEKLLSDEESKMIYRAMIEFRSTYDMRKHPGYTLNDIYFVKGIVQLAKNEVFVDCGAFDGDSVCKFLENTNDYKKIVAFEPDRKNYEKLTRFQDVRDIVLCNEGVWSENAIMYFDEKGNEVSRIAESADDQNKNIKVVAIDNVEECRMATYIKMDIEGAEAYALKGAQEIIKQNHPRLAISIYHEDKDMVELPLYIHSLVPEYKMYVRQHSHSFFDTVLYCVSIE